MNLNYDRQFEEIKKQRAGSRLLLHVCCAPCATYCLTRVLDAFDVTLYFHNDNVFPLTEWEKRLNEVRRLTEIVNDGNFETPALSPLKLEVKPFDYDAFLQYAKGLERQREGGLRCAACFEMRLDATAKYAKEQGFDLFGTTLTVSPYKNSTLLNQMGERAAAKYGADFLYSDFKKRGGYNESIRLSQKYALYRQHYCGCAFSLAQLPQPDVDSTAR